MSKCFISYRREEPDKDLARGLKLFLEEKGHEAFMDIDMLPGEMWADEIPQQIKSSDFFIVLLSRKSIKSSIVKSEVEIAHDLRKDEGKIGILPVRVDFEGKLPIDLAKLNPFQYVKWDQGDDLKNIASQLLLAIEKHNSLPLKEKPGDEETSRPKMESLADEDDSIDPRKRKYYNDLKNEYTAPLSNDDTGMNIADIYVEPKFRVHKFCVDYDHNKDHWESSSNSFMTPISYDGSVHQFIYDILRNNNPIKGLRRYEANVILILGFPGQGKSSFCKKTIYDIVAGKTFIDGPFYFLRFKDIQDVLGFTDNPLKVIKEKIEDDLDLHSPLDKSRFKSALLILDGLDELYMRKNMDINLFDEVCKAIIRFTKQKVVITSRYGCLDIEGFKHEEVLILQLKEFELEQKIRWLNKFKKFHEDIFFTVELLKKYNDREKFAYINELTKQPLLLHMLATSNFRIEDPSNRARIYDKLFDNLIDRKYEKSRHFNLKNLEKEDIEKFIMDIALSIFHTGNEYIYKTNLLKYESKGKLTDKPGGKSHKDSSKGFFMAFYFSEVRPDDKNNCAVEFLHKSLFRYMVAKKIWQEMKVFLHYNQASKDYSINHYENALYHIFNLFSKQLIPLEIVNYLIEIIKNDTETDKEKIAERMSSFFPQLIEKDFISSSTGENINTRISSLNTFYGYWTLLSNLCEKKNHITRDIKDKFVFMVKSLLNLYKKRIKMDLSHQWLNGVDLREAFLCGINFSEVHLCGADIRRASLNGSILHKAVLSGANLSEAYFLDSAVLSETNFNGAILNDAVLSGAILRDSILRGVDFSRAVLSNANFNASDLSGANLTGAVLSETDFREAILLGTDLSETDLSETYLDNANLQGAILDKENYQLAKEAGAIVSETNE